MGSEAGAVHVVHPTLPWRVEMPNRAMPRIRILRTLLLVGTVLSATLPGPRPGSAQGSAPTFPQTGQTVRGEFLAYWARHGGLAQQGYPISAELQEVSETTGQSYTVQYFERAVFEHHPDNP